MDAGIIMYLFQSFRKSYRLKNEWNLLDEVDIEYGDSKYVIGEFAIKRLKRLLLSLMKHII